MPQVTIKSNNTATSLSGSIFNVLSPRKAVVNSDTKTLDDSNLRQRGAADGVGAGQSSLQGAASNMRVAGFGRVDLQAPEDTPASNGVQITLNSHHIRKRIYLPRNSQIIGIEIRSRGNAVGQIIDEKREEQGATNRALGDTRRNRDGGRALAVNEDTLGALSQKGPELLAITIDSDK